METFTLGVAIPQLPSGDIDVTGEFFVTKLGFEIIQKFTGFNFLIVRRGAAEIHFWQAEDDATAKKFGSASSCYIRVKNIFPLYEELRQRDAPFQYHLEKKPWGMNEMQIDDPYGNAIRFGEPV